MNEILDWLNTMPIKKLVLTICKYRALDSIK